MSQWRGQIENIDEPADVVEFVGDYYHVPTVLLVLGFMLWSRVENWKNFLVNGNVYFTGNDPWYHYRMVAYTVRHWPQTSPFDPWTYFPYGTHSSQFGTIMDQFTATVALVVGLGSPSEHTIKLVALFVPAVVGVLVALPVYAMAKRVSNRFGGVVAVLVLALSASSFLGRSTVGSFDHHVAEALMQTLAVFATMIAVSVAEEEKPVWELFEARDVDALRRPVGWALVAGVAVAAYIWTWPPGAFLLGVLGVYFLLELASEYASGESPEHVAIAGAVALGTAGVLTLATIEDTGISATSFNLLQPAMAFGIAVGCAFMAWLAREWDARGYGQVGYPVAVLTLVAVLAGLFAVVLPNTFGFFVKQTSRVVGLTITETAATVAEAQPMEPGTLYDKYRFTIFIAGFGIALVAVRHFFRRPRAEVTLLAFWTTFMLLATLTQGRFDYYLGVAVAVMTGVVVGQFADFAQLFEFEGDIETYQLLTILAVVLVVFAPLVYPTMVMNDVQLTGQASGPGSSPVAWNQSLSWMQDNTAEEGNFAGAGNDMPYYGTFERTNDFEYEEGFYGVLSWWDYGHWITTMGERIPNANPFQQGSDQAANFLLAPNETMANDVAAEMSDGENAETRYVMVDWQMVSTRSKYTAPIQFTDMNVSVGDYVGNLYVQNGNSVRNIFRSRQRYYDSTVVRLYRYHGSRMEAQPVVLDWRISQEGGFPVYNRTIRDLRTMAEARSYVRNDTTSMVGGIGRFPSETVPALEHYRLVQESNRTAPRLPLSRESGWTKVFERVPGATIEGDGPENATVTASVRMRIPARNATFSYRQQTQTDADGSFTMTVPYSTTGYDEYGPSNGHTNVSVRAAGPYRIQTGITQNVTSGDFVRYNDTVDVTEGQVIGEDDSPAEADLQETVVFSTNRTQTGNESAGNGTDGETGTDGSSGDGESGTDGSSGDGETGTDGSSGDGTTDGSGTSTDSNSSAVEAPDVDELDAATLVPLAGLGLVGLAFVGRRAFP